jgi:hypothetical protein
VQDIRWQLLKDQPGFEAGSAFKISVCQFADSDAGVQMGLSPCGGGLVDSRADQLALTET